MRCAPPNRPGAMQWNPGLNTDYAQFLAAGGSSLLVRTPPTGLRGPQMTTPTRTITAEEIATYESDGVAPLRGVLPLPWVEEASRT